MASASVMTSPGPFDHLRTSPTSVADNYRGAVVEVRISFLASHTSAADRPVYSKMALQDLQLSPAFALPQDEAISRAIELAYDRDFSHIPYVLLLHQTTYLRQTTDTYYASVLNRNRKPVGYVDVARLKEKWEAGNANPVRPTFQCFFLILGTYSPCPSTHQDDKVLKYMTKFKRSSSEPYTLITPSTPLADLERFLQGAIFALGLCT